MGLHAQPRPAAADPGRPTHGLPLLDAIELTLNLDPNIELVEAQLDASRGSLMSASSRFDPQLTADLQRDDVRTATGENSSSRSESLSASTGLRYELRSGLLLTPSVSLDRDERDAANQATVAFSLRQPLLRGRGRDVVAAAESAAAGEVEASYHDLQHTIAQRLRTVTQFYWQLLAAQENLAILRQGEARSRTLMETTRRLIEADVTPAADLIQLQADLTAREAARIGGEENVFSARQVLGREIGLDAEAIAALPAASEPFPEPVLPASLRADAGRFIARARALRSDLQAQRVRSANSRTLERAAANAVQPSLDLIFTPSYSGFTSGSAGSDFLAPLWREVPGLSASIGLSLTLPIGHRLAEGQLLQEQSARRQRDLQRDLLETAIGADVPAALEAVISGAAQLERAREAVSLFEQAVENEEKKQRVGRSTLLDVINQRDRLTSAQQRLVNARLNLALALLDLRFQTGTLWTPAPVADGNSGSGARTANRVSLQQLTTLPPLPAANEEPGR